MNADKRRWRFNVSAFIRVYLRFYFNNDPRQFRHLCRPVSGAIIDDYDPVRVLAGAQDYRAYADLFVVGGEDGGYGGQVSTSGGWVWWVWVGGSG